MVADSSALAHKKAIIFRLSLCVERKTRLEPALRACNSRELLFTPPNPLKGGTLGSLVANLVFRSKQSLPYQREVWRDCLYGRGLFRETHKKRIALCYPSCVERKTRVCPSALHSVYQAITFAQYYTPNSRDTWVVSRCRFRIRLLPYKLQNYSCLR